jgi:hypothetical protein
MKNPENTRYSDLVSAGAESAILPTQRDWIKESRLRIQKRRGKLFMLERQRLLELALKGLEADRASVDDEIIQIKRELNNRVGTQESAHESVGTTATGRKRRRMSAAARKRISEGMKRRYAALKAIVEQPSAKPRRTGGMTAAGRKRISELMKARWAVKRKVGKKAA